MRKSIYTVCAVIGAALMMNLAACSPSGNSSGTEAAGETSGQAQTQEETEQEDSETVDLNEVLEEVKGAYGSDYLPDTAIDETTLEQTFGIDSGLYQEFAGEMCTSGSHADMFLAVRAADGEEETVEQLLNAYRDSQIGNADQSPASLAKYKASQVVSYGNDVYFVMLGAKDDGTEDEEQLEAFYESQTQIGLDMIESFYE